MLARNSCISMPSVAWLWNVWIPLSEGRYGQENHAVSYSYGERKHPDHMESLLSVTVPYSTLHTKRVADGMLRTETGPLFSGYRNRESR